MTIISTVMTTYLVIYQTSHLEDHTFFQLEHTTIYCITYNMAEVKIMQRCVYVSTRTNKRCSRYTQNICFLCCDHTDERIQKTYERMREYRGQNFNRRNRSDINHQLVHN